MRNQLSALSVASLLACLGGCVSHGVPTHGGGKRFHYEQQVVTECIDEALGGLTWEELAGKVVNLQILAVNDQGGGVESGGSGLDIGGFFGFGKTFSPSGNSAGIGGVGVITKDDYEYNAYAIANARDIEYVKGVVIEKLLTAGARIEPGSENLAGTVYVLVDTLGIDKSDFSVIVYREVRMDARAGIRAFFAPRTEEGKFFTLGDRKLAERKYRERSIFGIALGEPTIED